MRTTLFGCGLLVLAVCAFAAPAFAGEAAEDGGTADRVYTFSSLDEVEEQLLARRLKKAGVFEDLPEGHTIQVVYKHYVNFDYRMYSLTQLDKKDRPHGVQQFYQPGWWRVTRSITWDHGVKDGLEVHYDLKGRKKTEIPYVDGEINGTKKTFYPGGEVRNETEYVDGKAHGETRTYSPEGRITRKGEYVEGERHGKLIDSFPRTDGQPRRIVPYKNGQVHGTVKEFYENGNPKRELPFVEDRMHGVEKEYDGEGNLENEAYWFQGDRVSKDVYEQRVAGKS